MAQYDDGESRSQSITQNKQHDFSKSEFLPNEDEEDSITQPHKLQGDVSEIKANEKSKRLSVTIKEDDKSGEEKSEEEELDPKEKAIKEYIEKDASLVMTRKQTQYDRIVKFYEQNMKRGKIQTEEEDEDNQNGIGLSKKNTATITKTREEVDDKTSIYDHDQSRKEEERADTQSKNEDGEKAVSEKSSEFDDDPERKNKSGTTHLLFRLF